MNKFTFKAGKLDGLAKHSIFSNEDLNEEGEENFKDGKPDGLVKSWHSNGQLKFEFNFKVGKPDGLGKLWYDNGQLDAEFNYKDGKLDGLGKQWHSNGQLELEVNYKDGKEDGLGKRWIENGQLRSEQNYKDGELDGLRKSWHNNGQLELEVNYKDGKEDGLEKWWSENGKLEAEFNYKDGKRVGLEKKLELMPNGQILLIIKSKHGLCFRIMLVHSDLSVRQQEALESTGELDAQSQLPVYYISDTRREGVVTTQHILGYLSMYLPNIEFFEIRRLGWMHENEQPNCGTVLDYINKTNFSNWGPEADDNSGICVNIFPGSNIQYDTGYHDYGPAYFHTPTLFAIFTSEDYKSLPLSEYGLLDFEKSIIWEYTFNFDGNVESRKL